MTFLSYKDWEIPVGPINDKICISCLNNGLGKECSSVARCVSNLETNDEEQLEECQKCYDNPDLEQCNK